MKTAEEFLKEKRKNPNHYYTGEVAELMRLYSKLYITQLIKDLLNSEENLQNLAYDFEIFQVTGGLWITSDEF